MKNSFKKYIRFWFWVDVVGLVFSLVLIFTYLIWADNASDHLQNLWSNLAIEVLGVWLSVRIIDFLIQRHKSFKETRFHQLRNLGFFVDTADHVITYGPKERDIEILEREILYFDKRWPKRKKHFYKDEINQVHELRESMLKIIETCLELSLFTGYQFSEVDYEKFKEILKDQIYGYRQSLER